MMPTPERNLGILRPLGGGDPIDLLKPEIVIGRRKTCDVRLDFDNVSGRHCILRLIQGVWHIRDLSSTNGTTLNGQRLANEHGVMPDDEIGVANHYYTIDYDPVAPTSLLDANQILEEEIAETNRLSLMEMAGLHSDAESRARARRITRARQANEETEFEEYDNLNRPVSNAAASSSSRAAETTDDDFFRMIQEDVEQKPPGGSRQS